MSMAILRICLVADSVCLLYCNLIRYQFQFQEEQNVLFKWLPMKILDRNQHNLIMPSEIVGWICLKMKSDVLVTTGWLIWPISIFDDDRDDHEEDFGWEYDRDGSRLVRWSMIIMNAMFLVIMQRWVRYRWLLPISMFDDNKGKVSMIQVTLAYFDVRWW